MILVLGDHQPHFLHSNNISPDQMVDFRFSEIFPWFVLFRRFLPRALALAEKNTQLDG